MAAPIDSALYRMKAYGKLLQENGAHAGAAHDPGDDILALVAWIEYARPLLGAVTTEAQAVNPFARHGLGSMSQAQSMAPPEPKPEDDEPNAPEETPPQPPPAETPPEDKPVA